jgi:hypothetical protein
VKTYLLTSAVALALAGYANAQLMVPDSGAGDRIMLFDAFNGSLIDANWITDIGAPFVFTTPKEAAIVGNQIWVSDQVADAIHRFDLSRNYLGSITALPAGLPSTVLDNIRGFGSDGTNVYLTMFHGNTALRGIVTIDIASATATSFTAYSPNTTSLFDAEPYQSGLLVTNSSTNNVEHRNFVGGLISNFATTITFPQQVATMPDGTIIATSTIAAQGIEGVYHFSSTGTLLRYIDTEGIKLSAGEIVPRGAWTLGNGGYLVTTSNGVFVVTPTGPGPLDYTFTTSIGAVDAQYVNPIPEPGAICLIAMGAGLLLRRRR